MEDVSEVPMTQSVHAPPAVASRDCMSKDMIPERASVPLQATVKGVKLVEGRGDTDELGAVVSMLIPRSL